MRLLWQARHDEFAGVVSGRLPPYAKLGNRSILASTGPLLEQVAAPISAFNRIANSMRQRHSINLLPG
jgi:hypothetical protein